MSFEDQTLRCVQCSEEFVFTVGEQEFYKERGLESQPKRCKSCLKAKKKKKRARKNSGTGYGTYRSPAFEGSAPRHQRIRGRRPQGGINQEYRSPAFKEHDHIKPEEEYRSPAFQEYAGIDTEEEYRAPGFKEYDNINPNEEYRAPGFAEYKGRAKDEKPMFSIVCSACGQDAMVPFLPEEKENPMCQECYRAHREKLRAEQEQQAQEQQAQEQQAQESIADDVAESVPSDQPES